MATRDPGPLAQAASKAVAGRAWDRTSTDAHQSRAGAAAPAQQVQPRIDTLWPVRFTKLGKTQVSQRRQNSLNSYAVTDEQTGPQTDTEIAPEDPMTRPVTQLGTVQRWPRAPKRACFSSCMCCMPSACIAENKYSACRIRPRAGLRQQPREHQRAWIGPSCSSCLPWAFLTGASCADCWRHTTLVRTRQAASEPG